MELRTCRVTITDLEGVAHTVQVTAETLYEAVALGLKSFRGCDWMVEARRGSIVVTVQNVPVEHKISFEQFNRWLEQQGKTPIETIEKGKSGKYWG